MLKRVHIKNFRCLRDVELELEPLTILVGPNASGKSAILDALDASSSYSGEHNKWQHEDDLEIQRRFEDEEGNVYVPYDSSGSQQTNGLNLSGNDTCQKLQLDLDALRSTNEAEKAPKLRKDGANLTNVFSTLSRDEQIAVRDEFCELVPVFSDVDVEPVTSGNLQLRFHDRWKDDVVYTPEQVSDGTMLMLAFLVLQYQKSAPEIVAVEEPERGLHPYLLEQLVQFFRELATGKRGPNPFNMVLATHSAELLDYAEPGEVRFLDRDSETGETTIERAPVDDDNWEETMDHYLNSLGNAWLSGGLGGVPAAATSSMSVP